MTANLILLAFSPSVMELPMKLFDLFEKYDGTSEAVVWIQQTKVIAEKIRILN